ncbi:signal transducer and transcription activator isoform X2 [Teleopsis dalmanni]|uniref:signal transducer and transcription activator isoform X2 n=1 Tax=Teleopsis dalmanni TaxID=139649 RepID=UPI0018CCF0C4|nr:signal transducer and transcription activator isoform X2 [Teleopsis dalmanni]
MSLWKRIACSPEAVQRMKIYYDEKGLADVRVCLAQWIEERIMTEQIINPTTDLFEQIAHQFREDLKLKLISLSNDNLFKLKLSGMCAHVSQTPAVDLYHHFHNGLQKEFHMIEALPQNPVMYATNYGNGIGGVPLSGNLRDDIGKDSLLAAHARIQHVCQEIERIYQCIGPFRADYDTFNNRFNEFNQNKVLMNTQQQAEHNRQLEEGYKQLMNVGNGIIIEFRRIITDYDSTQECVMNELKSWKRNQALAGNGAQFRDNLDEIQRCIELLVEIVGKLIRMASLMNFLTFVDDITELIRHLRYSQEVLVFSAFVVEKQPPQVMKTHTRFAAAVRWLIGPQLGVHMNTPTVECVILSEAQALRQYTQRLVGDSTSSPPPSSGEILNNLGTLEYQQQTRVLQASFRNMQLKKIKRAEKKGTESVMDEKFSLLFYTSTIVNEFKINVSIFVVCLVYKYNFIILQVWTLSLPVVVIVHGNQEPQSWATITWDNAFSEIMREPFQVPERVSWSQLSLALNTKFTSATGRSLTEDNLNFLYEKLFRSDGMGDHNDYITWAQFCKEPLLDRQFTFWDWFYAIMKLTKDHILGLWKAGLVVGFINKLKTTDEILRSKPTGTFLVRFSDSELGAITIAFVNDNGTVLFIAPWAARDLQIRGLADRIHDIHKLCYLYPDKPKDDAFGEFYTQRAEASRDGYVSNSIKAHVPAIEDDAMTPQHVMQSPQSTPHDISMQNIFTTYDICRHPLSINFCVE